MTVDELPERKNCYMHPSRIYKGLINPCEGLTKGRLVFYESTLLSCPFDVQDTEI